MKRAHLARFARSWICSRCRPFSSSSVRNANSRLPDSPPARTRFAPSPTGHLHLGSLRTALFNYLLAKRTNGQFLLRIEDTDQKRTIPGAEQQLYEDLRWAGLDWDEGPNVGGPYGPYRQSERTAIYRSYAHDLISNGHAYRCFCSPERLDALARHRNESGLPSGYDRQCAGVPAEESEDRAAKGEAHVVRLRIEQYPMYNDLVYGKTSHNRPANKLDLIDRVYGDPILLKSDGHPTYHLANVVDDHSMKITHVIRGTEWMPSTPMHVALYKAFNWTPPRFGHVPLLVDHDRQKLSKRNADIDLSSFRDKQGIFPATLINFAALLGWSHRCKSDVLSLKQLEQIFDLKITKGNTVVTPEKLWFLQKAHAQRFAANGGPEFDDMVSRVCRVVEETHPMDQLSPILQSRPLTACIAPLLRADAKSYTTAQEFMQRNSTFFTTTLERPPYVPASSPSEDNLAPTTEKTPTIPVAALHTAASALCFVPETHWNIETHRYNISSYDGSNAITSDAQGGTEQGAMTGIAADKTFKKELYHYLRWALSAGAPGPGIPETMTILGRAETIRRLQEAKELTVSMAGLSKPDQGQNQDRSWMESLAS